MSYYSRLKDIREDNDLMQEDVARILNTTRQQISKWENGTQMMGIDKYIALAKYNNISLDYLAGLANTPNKLK